jgi:adenylate cyclase
VTSRSAKKGKHLLYLKESYIVLSANQNAGPIANGPSGHTRLESRNQDAFAEAERQGLMLAAKVRTIALLVIIIWYIIDSSDAGLSYFYELLEYVSFLVLGVLQFICARQRYHTHVLKYVFVFVDCALLAIVFSSPNPFDSYSIPPAVAMDGSRFVFFFMFLMQSTFSFRPRLVLWCGFCIAGARTGMLVWFLNQPGVFTNLSLPQQSAEAFLRARPDPNFIFLGYWATEILVSLIVAAGLAVVVRRSRRLVQTRAIAERARANLARYFSPNVVDHLSTSKDPLSAVRQQDVAVLFADIMGFTKMCEDEPAGNVIEILRDYHNRLGQAVFDNGGTLDKYIGDGLMATFGTPEQGPHDARNALKCALGMIAALERWNAERAAAGAARVRVGIGLHYGSVIAGDIGNERRLEYSVIGDTVNIASRLESLTRSLNSPLVVSDDLVKEIAMQGDDSTSLLQNLSKAGVESIKGREAGVEVWILKMNTAV